MKTEKTDNNLCKKHPDWCVCCCPDCTTSSDGQFDSKQFRLTIEDLGAGRDENGCYILNQREHTTIRVELFTGNKYKQMMKMLEEILHGYEPESPKQYP